MSIASNDAKAARKVFNRRAEALEDAINDLIEDAEASISSFNLPGFLHALQDDLDHLEVFPGQRGVPFALESLRDYVDPDA